MSKKKLLIIAGMMLISLIVGMAIGYALKPSKLEYRDLSKYAPQVVSSYSQKGFNITELKCEETFWITTSELTAFDVIIREYGVEELYYYREVKGLYIWFILPNTDSVCRFNLY